MALEIYCFEQRADQVPPGDEWLSPVESARLSAFPVEKRRAEWRLGRWTAKLAAASFLQVGRDRLAEIEIRARPSGAPEVIFQLHTAPVEISLSHRDGVALCAVTAPGAAIGCDLEVAEEHSAAFVRDYFTGQEQDCIFRAPATARPFLTSALWSAKESALKALQQGLRLDTRSVSVSLDLRSTNHQWYTVLVNSAQGEEFHGWWQTSGGLVRTVVACPRPVMPKLLRPPTPAA